MYVSSPTCTAANDELVTGQHHAHEPRLRFDRAATRTGAERGPSGPGSAHYDETSESQLIARWRSRARSPMSMPVAVAT